MTALQRVFDCTCVPRPCWLSLHGRKGRQLTELGAEDRVTRLFKISLVHILHLRNDDICIDGSRRCDVKWLGVTLRHQHRRHRPRCLRRYALGKCGTGEFYSLMRERFACSEMVQGCGHRRQGERVAPGYSSVWSRLRHGLERNLWGLGNKVSYHSRQP